jgi:hypothetical protein
MPPSVSIAPTSGPPGTEIEVTVKGFPPDQGIQLGVEQEGGGSGIAYSERTGDAGRLTTTLAIPTYAEPEQRWMVTATTGEPLLEVPSNVFTVTEQQYFGAVTISPSSGPAGTPVQVTGEDFPPEAAVEIGIGPPSSEYEVIETTSADDDGNVAVQIAIPEFVDPDDDVVIVVSTMDHVVKAVSDPFDVTDGTGGPSATATPEEQARFTRTDIYLIALGDEGASGEPIGCGDSLIPVEVEIEPTVAPLTAALNELLSIESEYYGQSGLYNALHRSDLTVEGVDIEDGRAIIVLSGTVRVGGACDVPRVRGQLEATALQYDTVDEVTITIDGQPLEDVLQP